ncbi:hypothetical protein ACQKFK_32425 [Bacillus mycoides]|uniref:hypothetical protein n=1 Tax=Bacillus mycoides TaxID=1405 RepID=UPI003CFF637A
MNTHGKNEEWNQHHDGTCGCQQNKQDYGYEQIQEHDKQQYASHEYKNQEYTYKDSCGEIGTGYHNENNGDFQCDTIRYTTPNLPVESTRFQTITNINTNDNGHRVMDAMNIAVGTGLEQRVGGCPWQIDVENTVVNEQVRFNNQSQLFVFYQTDSGQFVIANRGNGRVLEMVEFPNSDPQWHQLLISSFYENRRNQLFDRRIINNTDFLLTTITETGSVFGAQNCHNNPNAWQIYTTVNENESVGFRNNTYRFRTENNLPINIPPLRSGEPLGPLPALRYLQDSGLSPAEAPRAVIGSALLPAIFVEDVLSLPARMAQSPYYVLEYRQYWHRLWSDIIPANGQSWFNETTGMLGGAPAQGNMRNTISMSIAPDLGIRFGTQSMPFSIKIAEGLGRQISNANIDIGETSQNIRYDNPQNQPTRFARFALANEYALLRMDGRVMNRWTVVDRSSMYLLSFPQNALLTMQCDKIIRTDNSYDLSVWKTPMQIKSGQVITKNEKNSKPYNA